MDLGNILRDRPILVLGTGFGAIVVLMAAIVSFDYAEIRSQRDRLESLIGFHNARTLQAQKMRNAMRDRMVMTGLMVLEDDHFTREEIYDRYLDRGQDFLAARTALEGMARTAEERGQIKTLKEINVVLTPHMSRVTALARQDRREAARREYLRAAHPKQRQALDLVDTMIQTYVSAARQVEQEAQAQIDRTVRITGVLAVVTLAVSILIAIFAVRRVSQDRQDLIRGGLRERLLRYRTTHDALTGLLNRDGMAEYLAQTIAAGTATHDPFALLLLDLDGFKQINDSYTHETGDRLLVQVAGRLRQCLPFEAGAAIRLAGDEFVVVSRCAKSPADAAVLAETILQAVGSPYVLDGREHVVTVSIGVALYPEDASTAGALLHCADIAMYRAKGAGKNRFQRYFPEFANDKTRRGGGKMAGRRRSIF